MSSKEEFTDMCIDEIQTDYFLGEFIHEEKGLYYYRTYGMNAPKGSLILFQFDNCIIAAAKLLDVQKDSSYSDYKGAFEFDINLVRVFEPITVDEINKIDSNITVFSQAKQEINLKFMKEIEALIKSKQTTFIPEELPKQCYEKLIEGEKNLTARPFSGTPMISASLAALISLEYIFSHQYKLLLEFFMRILIISSLGASNIDFGVG